MQPQANDRSRICLEFNESGLTVLGNREALVDLRAQLDWLLEGPPEDHWHCHVLWSLENDESRFDGKRPRNAGVIVSEGFQLIAEKDDPLGPVVDLTFVHASDQTLDDKQKRQR
jgi:hypothetical protein